MAIEAELPDGRILEFPDGTDPNVIQATVKNQLGISDVVEPEPRTLSERVLRGIGLAGRDVVEGVAGVAGIVTDPIGFGVNRLSNLFGGPNLSSENLRGDISSTLGDIGVPAPESRAEQIGSRINQAVVGGGGFVGTGRAIAANAPGIARSVGQILAAQPGIQGASAATSAGAVEVLPEDASPALKIGVGLVGAVSPSAATAGAGGITRALARGGETGRQTVARNVEVFQRAGTSPTVGQATQGRVQQVVESGLSRAPGSAGVLSETANRQADEIAIRVQQVADRLAPRATAERAGLAIERGVKSFVDDFQVRARSLYDAVDTHIPQGTRVTPSRTSKILQDTTQPIVGAEATSGVLSSKFLTELRVSLGDDIAASADGALPYEAVTALRTRIGERLSNLSLVTDVTGGQLRRLYGALSDDLAATARDVGPVAVKASNRANNFYRAGRARIDAIERVINKNGGPEKVFLAATSGTKEGATVLRTVMKSLPDEGKRILTAAVIRRLGIATAGRQDASGTAFSIQTFLTNFAKLSTEARSTLFGRFGKAFQQDIDALSKVASNIREGSQVFANPSGTAQAVSLNVTAGGAIAATVFGRIELAIGLGALVGGANLSARLMTNPRFVRWLAQTTTLPQGALPAQIRALSEIASKTKDQDIALAVGLLQQDE